MKLKQRPEDFSVKESYRFDPSPDGPFRVYMMDKQKLSTFDAVTRLREKFGLKPGAISYCGLKDKQGRTEQLIAVNGFDVDMQEDDLRLKYLGRADKALSSANTTSNRFAVTVREVRQDELPQLTLSLAEVSRLGVINYFDSQRFGSLKHGQGFIAKDLIRGDFQAALRNYMAVPSPLDRTDDAKVKTFWKDNWGDWTANCPFAANKKYHRVISHLRKEPQDYLGAFLQIDSDYRAMLLFTYQSFLWNEGARRLLQLMLPREHIFPLPYQAGTLLFHHDAPPDVLDRLRTLTFPLLAPNSSFKDAQVEEAVRWVLAREKMTLEDLRIEESPRLLYFRHEERPLLVHPEKLVVGRPQFDEMNRGFSKVNIAFTLPPGSYATLVVKRLFHFGWTRESEKYEPRPWTEDQSERPSNPSEGFERPKRKQSLGERDTRGHRGERDARPAAPVAPPKPQKGSSGQRHKDLDAQGRSPAAEKPRKVEAATGRRAGGFRDRSKARKDAKVVARKAQGHTK